LLERLFDPVRCKEVTDKYPDYFTFDAETWFSEPANYALQFGENVGFAEYKGPGTYWVHFCFHTARGREAIQLTKDMLERLYVDCPVTTSVGLIEEGNRKARWLIRQVGFKSLGMTDTKNGVCEMFYWTKRN
jgi:hypothetical protein